MFQLSVGDPSIKSSHSVITIDPLKDQLLDGKVVPNITYIDQDNEYSNFISSNTYIILF